MKNVQINSKVEMIGDNGKKSFGTLYDIREDIILVSVSPGDRAFKLFYPQDEVELVIYDTESLCVFKARVIERESDDYLVYKLERISEVERQQRRDHVRIEYTSAIEYSDEEELIRSSMGRINRLVIRENNLENFKKGYIEDISGGGLKLRTNERLHPGLTLRTEEKLEIGLIIIFKISVENEDLVVKGEVCHQDEKEIYGEKWYTYGVKFIDVDEGVTDKIVEFVFLQMRKNKLI